MSMDLEQQLQPLRSWVLCSPELCVREAGEPASAYPVALLGLPEPSDAGWKEGFLLGMAAGGWGCPLF